MYDSEMQIKPEVATGCETLATLRSEGLATLPRYGSKRDVARMVQMSVRSVDNFMQQGCPHLKLGKRRVRFDLAEVSDWLRQQYHVQRRSA